MTPNEFRADLHCHSTCSDGTLTPTELVHLAKRKGLSGLSITDHDTIEAYPEAEPLCKELGIALLPGVEFSTVLKGTSVHILGYGFQADDPDIQAFCARHTQRRKERNLAILELLEKNGMPLSYEDLLTSISNEMRLKRSIGRPHIAMAMIKKGYVGSIQEAFHKYLREDKPCYAQGKPFCVEETIATIHKAKGIAVIAHPHLIPKKNLLKALLEMHIDGIECYYGKFQADAHKTWLKIAKDKNLLVTGGSDFHGTTKPEVDLGCSWIDESAFNALLNYLKK